MNPSPFHGIFSALGDTSGSDTATEQSVDVETEEEITTTSTGGGPQVGQIAVDIFERDDYYIIRAPIAGIRLSDIEIEVDGKVLTIRGTRSPSEEIKDDQYYLQECFWGEFSRSITLPCNIDPKRVKATFSKDSILKILIPKEEKVKIVRVSES